MIHETASFLRNEDIPFTMENGADQLRVVFSNVEKRRYQDGLHVTDVDVLVDYARSGMRLGLEEIRRDEFANFVKKEMAANGGVIRIRKDSGMFLAQ